MLKSLAKLSNVLGIKKQKEVFCEKRNSRNVKQSDGFLFKECLK